MKTILGITIFEWIVIILIFVIVSFYVICYTNAPNLQEYVNKHEKSLNWIDVNDFFKNADNGDLIFMSGDTLGERICRWCTGSMYSHVGILFREKHPQTGENILYIWDSDLGQKTKDGARISTLHDKFKKYHGFPYIMWKKLSSESKRPTTESLLNVISEYLKQDFDNNMLTYWVSEAPFLHNIIKNVNTSFCAELIAMTMQHKDINMLSSVDENENLIYPSWYSPKSFENSKIRGFNNDFVYNQKCYVKFRDII